MTLGLVLLIPIVPRADSGWWLVVPLVIAGCGLGLLVSQLNNYTLSPISDERVSEAAGVNSAAGSFGLSFGLAFVERHHALSLQLYQLYLEHRAPRQPAGYACAGTVPSDNGNTQQEQLASHPERSEEIIRLTDAI